MSGSDNLTGPQASPFDALAERYDREFTSRRLAGWLRAASWRALEQAFRPGQQVLELGCGTGEDALRLAGRGVQVTATDASSQMLAAARRKVEQAGREGAVSFARWDLRNIPPAVSEGQPEALLLSQTFDGAFANFGVLNCLPERRSLAGFLAGRIRPGGRLVLVLMGPLCPWEISWHLLHGRFGTAFRRLRSGEEVSLGDGQSVRVWYPSPRRLRSEFAPAFQAVKTVGIGFFLPPTYLVHLVERRPGFFSRLAARERETGGRFPWTWLNDHYLMVFERC